MAYLDSKKETINKFLPVFLLSYMTLLVLPYVFGRVDVLNNFFSSGISQLLYRFFSILYGAVYLLLIGLANKIRVKHQFIIGGCVLLLLFLISSIIGPHVFYDLDGNYIDTAKWWWRLFGFVRFGAAIVIFIFLVSFVPPVMKSHKAFNYSFYIIIGITLFAVLFSFVIEFDLIKSLFNGADEHSIAIRSIFQNKNSYGLFLFLASLATSYLIFLNIEDLKYYFFYIPLIIFTMMSILIGCRTAFVSCLTLIVYLFIRSLIILKPLSKKAFYVTISIIGVLAFLFILFMVIPALHQGSLKGLYFVITYTFSKFGNSFVDRVSIWGATGKFMNWHYLLFGANTTNSQFMIDIYTGYTDFHSCYVTWFVRTGIIGTMIYAALFIYVFYLIYKVIRKKPLEGVLVLIFLLSSMLYSTPESAILFVSTSLYTFITNLVTIVYLQYLLKE